MRFNYKIHKTSQSAFKVRILKIFIFGTIVMSVLLSFFGVAYDN